MDAAHGSELPEPPPNRAPRYSSRQLPAYRYVPGTHPHPRRDPAGHSYEAGDTRHPAWDPADWRHLQDWLYGVDLFNRFYFWEAHEAWEGLWVSTPRDEAPSLLLQGLIQVAAALLKTHMGVIGGARTLSAEGIDKLRRVAARHDHLLGLDLLATIAELARYFEPIARDELPRIDGGVPLLRLPANARGVPERR